ncbi:MAG TPA: RecX family transcriptional regulator [Bacillota bacterium]|nr:RecX family transcriptional regulator [Bacillota bacterium]
MERALRYLNRRNMTGTQLTGKLLKDGFEPEAVMECLEQIRRWGYLDDREYVIRQIESLQVKLKSRLYVEEYLLHSGVERLLVTELLDNYYPEVSELSVAKKLVAQKFQNKPISCDKKRQYLLRAGFSENTVGQCFFDRSST